MTELSSKDRLQPSLLDRLLDDAPQSKVEGMEARALPRSALRAAVLRDLSWLLNTIRQEPGPLSTDEADIEAWRDADLARQSVLNFGLPPFSGTSMSRTKAAAIENAVAQAIRNFEPRLDAKTLSVQLRPGVRAQHNMVEIAIRGQMWSQPVPLELLLSANLDPDTGTALVREARA